MVYKNFSKYDIDLENEKSYSFSKKKDLNLIKDKDGYIKCYIRDDKGNIYRLWHQVVYSVKNGLTKDEWPVDENGRIYEIDHIIPIKNGGTNDVENLRLVSKRQNSNNPKTIKNMQDNSWRRKNKGSDVLKASEETKKKMSEQRKGKRLGEENPNYGNHLSEENKRIIGEATRKRQSKPVNQFEMNGTFVRRWDSATQADEEGGFCQQGIKECCKGRYTHHHHFIWRYAD